MRFRIKYQILIIAMIPVSLIDAFYTYIHINSSINHAEELLKNKGEIIAQQIAGASEFSLLSGNYLQIQHFLDQSINTNNVLFLSVYDTEGNVIAQVKSSHYNSELSTEYSYYRQPIQTHDINSQDIFTPDNDGEKAPLRHLGWVHMYISKHQLQQNKIDIYNNGAIFFFAMLIIAGVLTMSISQRLTRPIYKMLNHLKRIETGQLGDIIDDVESNEIGDVQKGFNSMSQALLANRMQLDQKIKTATLELMNAITNLEYNNRELAIARDNAQKADQVKSQFLANMSHEIRTPINGIQGFINLLSNTGLHQDQQRYVNIIRQSTIDLTYIVNEILDFSKIESGKVELLETEFDLYKLVETTRDSLYASTLEKNIDLFLSIYSDTPRMLIGDVMRLKQILINLIGNAIKFTDQGYVSITVLMEDFDDEQVTIKFDIKDTGIGISADNQKSLFKAFKQIESDTNRRFSGTGLGLVISRNLASLMGGDIKLESKINSGTLFSLYIPFKLPAALEYQPENDQPRLKTAMIFASNKIALNEVQTLFNRINLNTETKLIDNSSITEQLQIELEQNLNYIDYIVIDLRHIKYHPDLFISKKVKDQCDAIVMHYDISMIDISAYSGYRFISVISNSDNLPDLLANQIKNSGLTTSEIRAIESITPKKILVVDDNSINLALACELTRLWGHDPLKAKNAQEAMALFEKNDFDLILLDIQMPEIDGVELMLMMREAQPALTAPIIAITANVLEKEKERLMKLGFDGYISKPIDEEKLRKILEPKKPVTPLANPEKVEQEVHDSIDFKLTQKLTAHNQKLVNSTLSMLQLEIPRFIKEIEDNFKNPDTEKLSAIIHKLRGVTCYVGLPVLKKLLIDIDSIKEATPDESLKMSLQINNELKKIHQAIDQYKSTAE